MATVGVDLLAPPPQADCDDAFKHPLFFTVQEHLRAIDSDPLDESSSDMRLLCEGHHRERHPENSRFYRPP